MITGNKPFNCNEQVLGTFTHDGLLRNAVHYSAITSNAYKINSGNSLELAKTADTDRHGKSTSYYRTFAAVVDVGLEAASRHVQLYLNSLVGISYRKYRYSTFTVSLSFF